MISLSKKVNEEENEFYIKTGSYLLSKKPPIWIIDLSIWVYILKLRKLNIGYKM